jgi:hypothetical protein
LVNWCFTHTVIFTPCCIIIILKLQNLDFTVVYKEGPKNTAADCLSRRTYKPEEKSETDQPKYDEGIPDPREIIEISFQ